MNEVVVTIGILSDILVTADTIVGIVLVKGFGSVIATGLVIREVGIPNEFSPYFKPFFILVIW